MKIKENHNKRELLYLSLGLKFLMIYIIICSILPLQIWAQANPQPIIKSDQSSQITTPNSEEKPSENITEKKPEKTVHVEPAKKVSYNYYDERLLSYPRKPKGKYPDIEVDGFYEGKFAARDYNPKLGDGLTTTDNRWEAIRNDPIYNKLPKDVLLGDPKFETRFKFNIDGQLSEDLSVHYDIEQEPDFPGKYDIRVKHKRSELTFHHLDAEFNNGDFINVKKALNGVKYTTETNDWELITALGQQRSDPKKYEAFGSGKKEFSVGNKSLLYGSVKVWVNNSLKHEGVDYNVDYYNGKVTFHNPPGPNEYIEIIYEFTNPIEDFIPVLNRKNFIGFQYKWRSKPLKTETKISQHVTDTFTTTKNIENLEEYTPFYLKKSPIMLGSDTIKVNDAILRKNVEYFIKHDTGRLLIKNQQLIATKNTIVASYEYFKTDKISEEIIGKDKPGPYILSRQHVLFNSLKIYKGQELLQEIRDYYFDAEKGVIMFNFKLDYPEVVHVEYEAIQIERKIEDAKKRPFEFGISYLNEYVSSEEEELESSVSSESITITNNVFYVAETPLINTSDIVIDLDGDILTTADYSISDLYTGEITLTDTTLTDGDIEISYDYQKSFRTNYIFNGIDGREGDAYVNNSTDFEMQNIPIKYNGVDHIRLWDGLEEIRLDEGNEYSIDYGDDGTEIEIRFFVQKDNNISRLDNYPDSSYRITVVYDYTPEVSPDPGEIDQRMVGITMGAQVSKHWSLNTEIAATDHNFDKPQIETSKTFNGNGNSDASYNLGFSSVVEDSESVFIQSTNLGYDAPTRLTKDTDYVLNYQTGRIRFINLIPTAEDEVVIDFKYIDNTSTTSGEREVPKLATKLESTYKNDSVTIKNNFKFVDQDFFPIGHIKDEKGITTFGSSLDWKINKNDSFNVAYERKNKLINETTGIYERDDELKSRATIKVFNLFDTTQTGRYLKEVQDEYTNDDGDKVHDKDKLTIDYDANIGIGPSNFRNTVKTGFSKSFTDYKDQVNPVETYTRRRGFSNDTTIHDLFILGTTHFSPYYETNYSRTEVTSGGSTTLSYTNRLNRGFSSKIRPLSNLTGVFNHNIVLVDTLTQTTSTANRDIIRNDYYQTTYDPFRWLKTEYSHKRTENESPLYDQKGKKQTNTNYKIRRYEPGNSLVSAGMNKKNFIVKKLGKSFATYSIQDNKTQENNNLKTYEYDANTLTYNNFSPLKGFTIKSTTFQTQDSTNINKIESSSASENNTQRNYEKLSSKMVYVPQFKYLNKFTYNFGYENRKEEKTTNTIANVSTSNQVVTERPYYNRNQKLSYNPGQIKLPLPFKKRLNLGKLTASAQESWTEDTNTKTTVETGLNGDTETTLDQDNKISRVYTYDSRVRPLNLFGLGGRYVDSYTEFSRNLSDTNNGLSFNIDKNFDVNGDYQPFKFFKINGNFKSYDKSFYKGPSLNATLDTVKTGKLNNDADVYEQFINRNERYAGLRTTFTPFRFISINNGASYSIINETSDTVSADSSFNTFNQITGTAGLTLRPLKSLSLTYDYTLKRTDQNDGDNIVNSRSGNTKANYTPFQKKNFKVSINYNRLDTWGSDLNRLDQSETEKGVGDTIQTTITSRRDTIETGSLNININIPLRNSPYIENFVVTGEGYLKRITDHKDDTKDQKRSYDISGIIIKGTLNF